MKITIKGNKTFIIDAYDLKAPWWAHTMPLDVEVIIIKEVVGDEPELKQFDGEELLVNKKMKSPVSIKMPIIVLIYRSI
jgi:hypothetical protein